MNHIFIKGFWIQDGYTGGAVIESCENPCDHAWLYKDAQQFGFEQYKHLIGNNAICLRVGPILEAEDADFIAAINNCPCKLKTFHHFCILHYHIQ